MALSVADMRDRLEAMQGYKQNFSIHPTVDERRIVIASDVHIPYYHAGAVAKMLGAAGDMNADAIVWLGDLLDNPTFSSWGNEDLKTNFDEELEQLEYMVRLAADIVPVQYWSLGNHEFRWMRRLGFQGDMRRLAMMGGLGDLINEGRLIVSDDPTLLYCPSDGPEWMLTHPDQYGSTPLVVPGKFADKYGKNVIAGHSHHWGLGVSPSGRYTVIESGGLFDAGKVKYVQYRVSAHRTWTRGFVMLEDGEPVLMRA